MAPSLCACLRAGLGPGEAGRVALEAVTLSCSNLPVNTVPALSSLLDEIRFLSAQKSCQWSKYVKGCQREEGLTSVITGEVGGSVRERKERDGG